MKLTSSKRLQEMLDKMGLKTPMDVLLHLPRRYEDYGLTDPDALLHLAPNQRVVIYGTLLMAPRFQKFARISKTTFLVATPYGLDFEVEAWNRTYLKTMLKVGESYTIMANVDSKRHCLNLVNIKKGQIEEERSLVGVYSLPIEFSDKDFRNIVAHCFNLLHGCIKNIVPEKLRKKYILLNKEEALYRCHFPKNYEDVRLGLRVLKYEEVLLFCLKNRLLKAKNKASTKQDVPPLDKERVSRFIKGLPYQLTNDQAEAVKEILIDLDSVQLMTRLLQGDVGSGKTLVAAIACFASCSRHSQAAFLAPTDTLARQHFETLEGLLSPTGLRVELLTGNLSSKERKAIKEGLLDGSIDVLVGTHALFSEDIVYANLGLAVIDEQHKFGVAQRQSLALKGDQTDILLLSATPIPRTLSLTLYGELDVSTLSTYPFARRQVETSIIEKKATLLNAPIKKELEEGGRVYLVCPQIESSEHGKSVKAVYEYFAKKYAGQVSLLHGKMKEEEKLDAIASFKDGRTPILVSTSVIEVGVDVKQAHVMEIFDPSHFSLSSLHQLRGRVGRDGQKAYCYLVYDGADPEEKEKLEVIVGSEDGFHIAEEDLRRRGPGSFAGTEQSGMPNFAFANLVNDFKMFEVARIDAEMVLSHLEEADNLELVERIDLEKDSISLA